MQNKEVNRERKDTSKKMAIREAKSSPVKNIDFFKIVIIIGTYCSSIKCHQAFALVITSLIAM